MGIPPLRVTNLLGVASPIRVVNLCGTGLILTSGSRHMRANLPRAVREAQRPNLDLTRGPTTATRATAEAGAKDAREEILLREINLPRVGNLVRAANNLAKATTAGVDDLLRLNGLLQVANLPRQATACPWPNLVPTLETTMAARAIVEAGAQDAKEEVTIRKLEAPATGATGKAAPTGGPNLRITRRSTTTRTGTITYQRSSSPW